ncbi:MAG: ACT domain-containing protein, partial [Desulfatiglandales bacterium]
IRGVEGVFVRLPNCCMPLPGEKVVGYLTRGRGITIHRRNCKNISKIENGRLVEIQWEPSEGEYYTTRVKVLGADRKGLLADITSTITKKNANIVSLDARTSKDRKGTGILTLEVTDINHLNEIIAAVRSLKDVLRVQRL